MTAKGKLNLRLSMTQWPNAELFILGDDLSIKMISPSQMDKLFM